MGSDADPPSGDGDGDEMRTTPTTWQGQPVLPPGSRPPASTTRPGWAIPVLIAGIACSLAVFAISAQYFAGQARGESPSLSFAYTFQLAPFFLVGLPLSLVGAVASVRPWSAQRPWLRWVVIAGVILWFLLALQAPSLL